MAASNGRLTGRDELRVVLASLAGVVDGDEPIDELAHALQCAQLARSAQASQELVAAALLHDIARSPIVASEFPVLQHEVAGAQWLEPRFGGRVAWLVGAHVVAKLHLLATESGYDNKLSSESKKSATYQRETNLTVLVDHPWWPDALRLRRWDDAAKRRDVIVPDPAEFLRAVESLLVR